MAPAPSPSARPLEGPGAAATTGENGFVVVLDHRIVTKSYGRSFLSALPDIEIVRDEFCRDWIPGDA